MIEVIGLIGEVASPYVGYSKDASGLIVFLGNIIKLITTVGGLMLFLNLVFSGLKYILSSSDPKTIQEAQSSIVNSIIGLIIIAASFIIVAVFSIIFFGDPTYILNPKISGPNQNTPKCSDHVQGICKKGQYQIPPGICEDCQL